MPFDKHCKKFSVQLLRSYVGKKKEEGKAKAKSRNYEIQFLRKGPQTNLCDSSTSHANVLGGLTAVFPYHLHPYSFSLASLLYGVPREQEGQSCESIQGPPSLDRLPPTIGSRRLVSLFNNIYFQPSSRFTYDFETFRIFPEQIKNCWKFL